MMNVDDGSLSFRELDDVFLQSQARIWLGEVLHTRFDEELSICDLLSDGEILFQVSKALWNMLLVKYMELNNLKARMFIPVDTQKSSGRYRPYSNVDSFLKVCKVLSLSGVDLFCPSDVVEKKDTRKVCICIRSLSKKARSKQLHVPDFDIVTTTVAMSTDVVRCIRRSLELSTTSVTHGHGQYSRLKIRQKSYFASHKQENESYLEESDEAKSEFSDLSYADFQYIDSEVSHETVNKYSLTQGLQQDHSWNKEIDKFSHTPGTAESLLLQYANSDTELDEISSPVCESRLIICDELTPINQGPKFWHDNRENAHSPLKVDHHISLSDMISFRILTNVPLHISEDCLCYACMGAESHNSNTTTPYNSMCRLWKKFPDDVDASPTSGVSSVVGRVLDFDFDANSEPDDLRTLVSYTANLQQHGAERLVKVSGMCNQLHESRFDAGPENLDSFSPCWDDAKSYCLVDQDVESLKLISSTQNDFGDSLVLVKDNIRNIAENIQETVNDKSMKNIHISDPITLSYKVDGICNGCVTAKSSDTCDWVTQHESGKGLGKVKKEGDQICSNQSDNVHCYAVDRTKASSKDERKEDGIDCLAEANTNGKNDKRTTITEKKATYIAPLLKTVAKGTALIGILFLLHFRNMKERSTSGKPTRKSSQIHWKSSGVGFSRKKEENGSKIYPVEKFKFGD